uniref:hypothetical protein n=1 Tax=Serratia quinivorans TaxID=137545 RepID=UPI0035C68C69
MNTPTTELSITLIFTIMTTGIAVGVALALNDIGAAYRRGKYEDKLKTAIDLGRLENEDIYLLASRWVVKKEQITTVLHRLLNEYVDSKECNVETLGRVRRLIDWHQKNDPFSDLPDDVRLQLQHIKTIAPDSQEEIIRLSKSLSDIYISNQRQQKRDRRLAWSGLAIGVVGFGLTLWSFIKN